MKRKTNVCIFIGLRNLLKNELNSYLCRISGIRNIFLILAASVVLIHNALPHQHHTDSADVNYFDIHEDSISFLELLQLGFHLDIGGDHLENFEKSDEFSLQPHFHIDYFKLTWYQSELFEVVCTPYYSVFNSLPLSNFRYCGELSFRGPPTV